MGTYLEMRYALIFRDDFELLRAFSKLRDNGMEVSLFPSPDRLFPACSLLLIIEMKDTERSIEILKMEGIEPIRIVKLKKISSRYEFEGI
ncbi:MAG: hypothetical protein DRP30_07505 [Thermotoga sp.]|nr:MAG: hypothetical protein DRP30_07505 [Thermotoga sp.]